MYSLSTDAAKAQDALRPLRNFVSLLSGATNDQTWAETDLYAVGIPGQFRAQGPNGVVIEGKPVTVAAQGQLEPMQMAPWVRLAALVALGWFATRGG